MFVIMHEKNKVFTILKNRTQAFDNIKEMFM